MLSKAEQIKQRIDGYILDKELEKLIVGAGCRADGPD